MVEAGLKLLCEGLPAPLGHEFLLCPLHIDSTRCLWCVQRLERELIVRSEVRTVWPPSYPISGAFEELPNSASDLPFLHVSLLSVLFCEARCEGVLQGLFGVE